MIKILRRVTFFIFLAVFLIGAPKIVFYALGYSYGLGSDKLIKTGLIYLSTTPPGATVYVGGRRYQEPTPAIIRDLLPGHYPIRISLKDHEVWSRNVPVEAAKASVLGKILLYPKKPAWRTRVSGRFEDFIAIPDTRYILLRETRALSSIQVYDWKEKEMEPLFPENSAPEGRLSKIYFLPSSTHVLIRADENGHPLWVWVDLSKEGKSRFIRLESFPEQAEKMMWSEKEPRYLFLFEKNQIQRFDTEKMTMSLFSDQARGYGIHEKKVFILNQENRFFRTDLLGRFRKALSKDTDYMKTLFGEKGFFEIQPLANSSLFFLGEDGRLVSNQKNSPLVEEGALGFHFDKKSHKVVVWKKDALGIVEFFKEKKQAGGYVQRAKVEWVLKHAENIQRAFWAHDSAYIVFQDKNRVYLLELETFGSPAVFEILETKAPNQIFYTDDLGELFYLDKKTGDLMSLELIPKWKVLEIPFSVLQEKEKEGKTAA